MVAPDSIRFHSEEAHRIAPRHGTANLHAFGPVALGTSDDHRDIDSLVTIEQGRSSFDGLDPLQDQIHTRLASLRPEAIEGGV